MSEQRLNPARKPKFEFRTFSRRKSDGKPKMVLIENGEIRVDNVKIDSDTSIL